MVQLKKEDRLYYARIIPKTRIYEVCEVIVRTVKDKRAYLFNKSDFNKIVFEDRNVALSKVKEAEENDISRTKNEELYYEEY